LLQELENFRSLENVNVLVGVLLLQVVLIVSFVMDFFNLSLSVFLNFVEIDIECFVVPLSTILLCLGVGCTLWRFEADESISSLSLLVLEELHRFNASMLSEQISKILLRSLGLEVFHVQIASSLGLFELLDLLLKLELSFLFGKKNGYV